jgi:hypothetical protein
MEDSAFAAFVGERTEESRFLHFPFDFAQGPVGMTEL